MFQVPKAEPTGRFEFLAEDGTELSLPLLAGAPAEAMAAYERGEEVNGTLLACDQPQTAAYVRRLDAKQLDALTTAWLEASKAAGVKPGESEASTDS